MSFSDIGEYHSKAMPPNIRKQKLRSKGDISPHVTVTDDIGYVYETDDTGEYKRTTRLIQKLEDADIVAKRSHLSHRDKEIAMLKYDPNSFIHRTIYQTLASCELLPERRIELEAELRALRSRFLCTHTKSVCVGGVWVRRPAKMRVEKVWRLWDEWYMNE